MAHLHFRRTVYKAGGQKAAARLEYISGTKIVTPDRAGAQLAYISNGREDLVAEGTRNLPAWANTAHDFFVAAEQYERQSPNDYQRRGNAFEEWKITIPHELSREQNLALVKDLLTTIAGDRLPCAYAFHDPQTLSGTKHNPHIHLLISGRITGTTDEYQRPVAQHFKRWNSKEPGQGGAQKDPQMNHQGAVKAYRVLIADVLNINLERHGVAARVHPDTLESRGIDRKPEPKLAPSESADYRKTGVVEADSTMAEVLRIREARAKQPPKEKNNAHQYWEQRKTALGLTRDMDVADQLAVLKAARVTRETVAPGRVVRDVEASVEPAAAPLSVQAGEAWQVVQQEAQAVWTDDVALWTLRGLGQEALDDAEREAALLWAEDTGMRTLQDAGWADVREALEAGQRGLEVSLREHEERAQARREREQDKARQNVEAGVAGLLRQVEALGEEEGQGRGARVRLFDRSEERERGMGF